MMSKKFLVDTDVLIDFLRGKSIAVDYIKAHSKKIVLASMSVAELYAGVRDGKEREELDGFVGLFPVLPVTLEIAKMGGLYKRNFSKSYKIGLADAIIAATAKTHKADLKTLNIKHFPMFKGLKPPYTKK
jgi:predicted nucleic acid-binding protein